MPALVGFLVAVVFAAVACSPSNPEPSPSPSEPAEVTAAPTPLTATPLATPVASSTPAPTSVATRPLAASGSIAVVHADGSLWIVDAGGRSTMLADGADGTFGFPTWSPDGSRIAVVRTAAVSALLIIDVGLASTGSPVVPKAIFQDPAVSPFYLAWTPDGKEVSFLASDANGISLRIAPADGSAPVDGSGPGSLIRAGSPFYYDWIDSKHLLAHIGTGTDAFLGEIGTDGESDAPAIKTPGIFRSPDMSGDRRYVGYVRMGKNGTDAIVVATRDGATEHSMPVFGLSAVDFSPTDDTLASIGAVDPAQAAVQVPIGPLRLIDARTGAIRTLLDGEVVSFAWSPDGKTIAAVRVVPAPQGTTSSTSSAASPAPSGSEIHLAFVDVASGKVVSDPQIDPGQQYVDALLSYFDQYALSHRLWAPDSSSILLPEVDPSGTTHVDVLFPNGDPSVTLDGEIGFWSP
jgi:TolB protein